MGNPGSYPWTIVSTSSSNCKVRVILQSALGNSRGSDDSSAGFTIHPLLSIHPGLRLLGKAQDRLEEMSGLITSFTINTVCSASDSAVTGGRVHRSPGSECAPSGHPGAR